MDERFLLLAIDDSFGFLGMEVGGGRTVIVTRGQGRGILIPTRNILRRWDGA
jgi:hypothetical protein